MNVKQTLLGLLIVALYAAFNVLAEQFSTSIVNSVNAPFFLIYFNTGWNIVIIPIYTIYIIFTNWISGNKWNQNLIPDLEPLGFKNKFSFFQTRYCLLFMFIYVGCNYVYVAALQYIPNTYTSAIMSLDPAIVFVFSLIFLNNLALGMAKNIQQLISSVIAICGVCLLVGIPSSVPDETPENNSTQASVDNAVTDSDSSDEGSLIFLGVSLACVAALLSGMYKIFYKYFFEDLNLGQCCYSLGIIGALNLILLWPVVLILFRTGAEESVIGLDSVPWDLICLQSLFALCFNLSLNFGIAFTYPLFISIGATLVAPANLLVDIYYREREFSNLQVAGSIMSVIALVILLLPVPEKSEPDSVIFIPPEKAYESLNQNTIVNNRDEDKISKL